jgi:uncharacterized protein (UPF0261 family)
LRGVSALDASGQPFDDPAARTALLGAIRANAGRIPVVVKDHHINDPDFAGAVATRLLEMLSAISSAVA